MEIHHSLVLRTNRLRFGILSLGLCIYFFLFGSPLRGIELCDLQAYRWTRVETEGDVVGRHENSFIAFKGKFYLIGGRGINPVNVYDPVSNLWETKGKTPMELHHFQAVVVDDAIYMMGAMTGRYPTEKPIEYIWIYYPENDKWVKGDLIPEGRRRGGAGSVLYQGKIYMVCGIEFGHTSGTNNCFDVYDLKTGRWETLTRAPHLRDHFAAIVVDDKLYCIGGRNTSVHQPGNFQSFFSATVPEVDVYDFSTEKWITLAQELPIPTAAAGVVHVGEHFILYMGGEGSQDQAYNQTQCLDIRSGEWTLLAPLNLGRHGSGAVVYNGDIYVAAGSQYRGGGNMNSMEVFSVNHNWEALFNGNDLAGWQVKGSTKDVGNTFWSVEDHRIICDSMGSEDHEYNWLQSVREFGDFELRLKFRVAREHRGNSGVQFRSRYDDTAKIHGDAFGWMDGPQADIHPGEPFRNGMIYDETRGTNRWIAPSLPSWRISKEAYAPKKIVFYFDDEESGWNDLTIMCKGNHVQTWVNNIVTADYDGTGVLDDAIHKKYNVGSTGHIALQLHRNSENKIQFKDIELRPLTE